MTMSSHLRKFALTAHITFSVGWVGAALAYLALAIAGLASRDPTILSSGFLAMEVIGWFVVVPLSIASLSTGLFQSLATEWGLVRHYWILVKFVLTVGATTILLLHMPSVGRESVEAEVIHAGGGIVVLLAATILSVYKPWGKTWYGTMKLRQQRLRAVIDPASTMSPSWITKNADAPNTSSHCNITDDSALNQGYEPSINSRVGIYVLIATLGLFLLAIVLHLNGGHGHH